MSHICKLYNIYNITYIIILYQNVLYNTTIYKLLSNCPQALACPLVKPKYCIKEKKSINDMSINQKK